MTAPLPDSVEAARRLVEPFLREAVDRLDPMTARVAGYHLGWNDPDGRPARAGGKSLRPALATRSARAAGANPSRGASAAAAVELVHAFSLLHDDIMDGDRTRRHRPTAWVVFGTPAAIVRHSSRVTSSRCSNPMSSAWPAMSRCVAAVSARAAPWAPRATSRPCSTRRWPWS